jgi:hypothetical protein
MDDRSRRFLECLVDSESFDDLLITLVDITHAKADDPAAKKHEQKQWRKASDRLVVLRDWCAQFGPGSDCR